MRSRTLAAAILTAQLLAGPVLAKEETRVFLRDDCPITKDNSAQAAAPLVTILLSALVTKAADSLVSNLADAVRKAGEKQQFHYSSYVRTNLYEVETWKEYDGDTLRLNPGFGCALIVIADFDESDGSNPRVKTDVATSLATSDAFNLDLKKAPSIDEIMRRLTVAGIQFKKPVGSDGHPAFVYEGRLQLSEDQSALVVQSRFLWAKRLQSAKRGSRGLAISLSIDGPSKDGKAATLSGTLMNLGNVNVGSMKWPWDFTDGKESRLMTMPALSDASKAALADTKRRRALLTQLIAKSVSDIESSSARIEAIDKLLIKTPEGEAKAKLVSEKNALGETLRTLRSQQVKWKESLDKDRIATNRLYMPIELNATLTETRDENKALLFIASVLDGAKAELSKEITDHWSPAAKAAAAEAAAKEQSEYTKSLEAAELAYLKARSDRAALKDDAKPAQVEYADAQIRITLESYNRVRAAGGLPAIIP